MRKSWMGWKMPLCKWHTFWMARCLICYFISILFYIERKWLLMRNFVRILSLKSKLSGNFQCFNAIDGNIEMLKTRYEVQTASRLKEIIQTSPTSIPPVLQECSSCMSRNGAMQIIFLTSNRNMFAGKFVKWGRLMIEFREHIVFNVNWVEVRKMSEVFRAKQYCKMSDLFR